MSRPPTLPFDPADRHPAELRLVAAPVSRPSEAEPFPFRLAVLIAMVTLLVLGVGARLWIVHVQFVLMAERELPVVNLSHVPLVEEEPPPELVKVVRREQTQPLAPRLAQPFPALPVQPEELVLAEWEERPDEPYDPTEVMEESDVPFPNAKPEPVAKVTPKKTTPKQTTVKTTRRSTSRPSAPPKPTGVSSPARVTKRYQPPYPSSARRVGAEGRVMLSVQVRSDGRVGSVRVSSSSGSAVLDSAAISAVKRWRFAAELKNGRAVTSSVNVPFRFSLR